MSSCCCFSIIPCRTTARYNSRCGLPHESGARKSQNYGCSVYATVESDQAGWLTVVLQTDGRSPGLLQRPLPEASSLPGIGNSITDAGEGGVLAPELGLEDGHAASGFLALRC